MDTDQPHLAMPDCADIVRPEERAAMRAWLEQALAAVRTTAEPAPRATLRRLRQSGFDGAFFQGLARDGKPLRLRGVAYASGIGMATGTSLLACEPDGNPVIAEAPLGKGRVVFVSFPVELRTISRPGAFARGCSRYSGAPTARVRRGDSGCAGWLRRPSTRSPTWTCRMYTQP